MTVVQEGLGEESSGEEGDDPSDQRVNEKMEEEEEYSEELSDEEVRGYADSEDGVKRFIPPDPYRER